MSALKVYGGKEIKKLARNLPDTVPVVGDNDYKKLKRKLDNHFLPKNKKSITPDLRLASKGKSKERVLSHTRRDCGEKSKDCEFGKQTDDRILEHLIQTTKDSELVKRSIQKKWNLDQFLEEDINQQVKDMREDFKISKVEYQSKDFPKAASGAEEETQRRNRCDLPENENKRTTRRRKAKAVVTVERREHTLQAETVQRTDNSD